MGIVAVEIDGDQLGHLDVNLEPNKTKVGLGCKPSLVRFLEVLVRSFYGLRDETEAFDQQNDTIGQNDTYGAELENDKNHESVDENKREGNISKPCLLQSVGI